jgi:hypothetical protein
MEVKEYWHISMVIMNLNFPKNVAWTDTNCQSCDKNCDYFTHTSQNFYKN